MRLVNYGKASSKIPSSEVRCPVAFAAGLLLGLILAAGALLMGRHLPPLAPDADDIYVSLGAYRDKECAQTLVNLFRQAHDHRRVFVGAATYTMQGNTSAAERCESPELAPYESNIRRLHLNSSAGRGPNLSRYHGAAMYGGQKYLLQMDSHMLFAPGWDAELIRMATHTPRKKAIITHYPQSWDNMTDPSVNIMCGAKWMPQGFIMFGAAVDAPTPYNTFRPVPFVAGGFMFAPAWVMCDVPYDPTLEFLFHGDEELYSARLWTHGWEIYTPDKNVIFHHYGRKDAPKFWDDFGNDPAYHVTKANNIEKVIKLMNGTYDNPGGYPYGMGKDRTVRQWWEYAGMDPADHSLLPRGDKFCFGSTFHPGPHAPDADSPRRSLRRTCLGLPRMDVAAGGRGGAAVIRAPGGSNIDGVEVYRPSRPRWSLQR